MDNRSRTRVVWGVAALMTLSTLASLRAQEVGRFEVGGQVPFVRFTELHSTDTGIGAHAAWLTSSWVGIEGEVNFFPNDLPDKEPAVTRGRVEGLFGATVGPRLGMWRPYGRVRPGFLNIGQSPQPLICPAIFPPLLTCSLSAGETLFALDLGGGVEWYAPSRTFVRLDVGDRLLRFTGAAIDENGQVHNDSFIHHNLRVSIGGGWRF